MVRAMRNVLLSALAGALLVAGAAAFDARATEPAAPQACTLETPLVPGVPGSPGHLIPTSLNPNGQSELAALMRTMQADLKAAGEAIALQQPVPKMLAKHARIRCSWPTTPSDRTPEFDAFAQAYLAQVAALETAPSRPALDRVLNACKSCHEHTCPGPISAIESLRLPSP
jgi:hypothetical protein